MEILSDILALGFLVALVVLIVFGVEWFKHRKDKEALEYRQWKKKFWIVFTVCAGLFILKQKERLLGRPATGTD